MAQNLISWIFGFNKKPKIILFCWFSEDEAAKKTVLGLRGIPFDYDKEIGGPTTTFPNKYPAIFVFIKPIESENPGNDIENNLENNMQLKILSKITITENLTLFKMKEFEQVVIICSQNYLTKSNYVYSIIKDNFKSNITIWNVSKGKN